MRLFRKILRSNLWALMPIAGAGATLLSPAMAESSLPASVRQHMAQITAHFDQPSSDQAWVMPVGSGDFSAMLRYENAWEIHLSKTDFFAHEKKPYHMGPTIHSPGHVQLSLGIPRQAIKKFDQHINFYTGSVVLTLTTDEGSVEVEAFGRMGQNTLLLSVHDTRPNPAAAVTYSIWRPEMKLRLDENRILTQEVHEYNRSFRAVPQSATVAPTDSMYQLGNATAIAFADEQGVISSVTQGASPAPVTMPPTPSKEPAAATYPAEKTLTMRPERPLRHYWIVIANACTYDGQPEVAAAALLNAAAKADKQVLQREQQAWWDQFWQASNLDLQGPETETLLRLWYAGYYSFACVGGGPTLPKFNGGPGLVLRDCRSWGIGMWWQNTREMIWPMLTANRPAYARKALGTYDAYFMKEKLATAAKGKLGLRMGEWLEPRKPGVEAPPKVISKFDPAALEKALTDLSMEQVPSGYNARSMAQSAELTGQMLDYVAYTGDREYLQSTVAPWLKETSLFWLSFLRKGEDGLYHSMVSDAAEMWWKVKDSSVDLAAARFCFWLVIQHGAELGYEADFIAAVRDRAEHLAPLPVGAWNLRNVVKPAVAPATQPQRVKILEIDRQANVFAPAGDVYDEPLPKNVENPELYLVFPFALVDANAQPAEYQRAVNTFRARRCPNHSGWSQCPVQAARLHLDETLNVIVDHAHRHANFPFGGWISPAGKLPGTEQKNVTDTPYFDAMGVNLTALQETLLQSHRLASPARSDLTTGGPLVLIPAVPATWSGQYKLLARGGFLVQAEFSAGRRILQATVECQRGGKLQLVNAWGPCQIQRPGDTMQNTRDPLIELETRPGEVLTFRWK